MIKQLKCYSIFREWYSYHFPELVKVVPENYTYARVAKFIKNRKELTDESVEPLEEIVMDSAKAQAILDASRSSMGMFHRIKLTLFIFVTKNVGSYILV